MMAFAAALKREAQRAGGGAPGELEFLLCELALELARVRPESTEAGLKPRRHKQEVRRAVVDLLGRIKLRAFKGPPNLRGYIRTVVAELSV